MEIHSDGRWFHVGRADLVAFGFRRYGTTRAGMWDVCVKALGGITQFMAVVDDFGNLVGVPS